MPSGNVEEQLIAYVQQLGENVVGWQSLHLHLSRLNPAHRRDYNIRIAVNGLTELVRKHEGRIFLLHNHDVIMVVRGAKVSEVEEATFQMRFLFQDDPLTKKEEAFSTWYDLSIGHRDLLMTAHKLLKDKHRHLEKQRESQEFEEIEPLDPNRLFKLQMALQSIDLSSYLRRQPVCAMIAGHDPTPVFEELYVKISDLQKPLMPNVNLFGNRWLFQHLTQTLDIRVLALLTRRASEYLNGPSSLNLNVDTLLSQSFMTFDGALRADSQHSIVVEMQAFDVFADVSAFQFGRDFIRRKGYRILLDGLKANSFTLFDREQLGVDLMKLYWDESMLPGDASSNDLTDAIKASGSNRVILAHCDNEQAIQYGYSVGITMFQGRYIDGLLTPGMRARN